MKVLLTGGSGNIGSHTLPQLVARGHTVRWFERLTTASRRSARDLPPGVEVVWGDITDAAAVATRGRRRGHGRPPRRAHPAGGRRCSPTRPVRPMWTVRPTSSRPARPSRHHRGCCSSSTFDVHGFTLDKPPPRHVDDPLVATNPYTEHKIECEALIRESGLDLVHLPPRRRADPRRARPAPDHVRDRPGQPDRVAARRRCRPGHRQRAGHARGLGPGTLRRRWTLLPADLPGVPDPAAGGDGRRAVARRRVQQRRSTPPTGSTPPRARRCCTTSGTTSTTSPRRSRRASAGSARLASAASPLARAAILRLSPYHGRSGAKP